MALFSGTRLGPYEILSLLGAGGMGEVFRARDTRLGRDVAIKVLPDHLSGDQRALARFESEAKAVAALSHPDILALFDVGETNGVHYAGTELLDGETLRSALRRGPIPWREAAGIAASIAEGLEAAHAHGIVHRDVEPENLFLCSSGHPKILDFGLAKKSSPAAHRGRPGRRRPRLLARRPPRQLRVVSRYDPRRGEPARGVRQPRSRGPVPRRHLDAGERRRPLVPPPLGWPPLRPPLRITELGGRAACPDVSPDGRSVAFFLVREKEREILVVPSGGGEPVSIAPHPGTDTQPSWAPDGTQLAFVSDRGGSEQVWTVPMRDGKPAGDPRRRTRTETWAAFPRSLPGGRLACTSGDAGSRDVWIVDLEGRRLEPGEPLSAEDLRQVARIIVPDPPRPAPGRCWPQKPGV